MASAQTGIFTAAGRGLQTSYGSRMSTQQQQQQQQPGGYNTAQARVEVIQSFIFNCSLILFDKSLQTLAQVNQQNDSI